LADEDGGEGARNKLVHLEDLSDDELEQLHLQFKRIQDFAKNNEFARERS
jgi:hypothetical protein